MTEAAVPTAQQRLVRATTVMASGTLISRILGFVRAILIAFALGNTTAQGDVFSLATVVPNSLYMLIAGGTFSSVLVPEIVRHVRTDGDHGEAYVSRIISVFGLALAILTVVVTVFTPQVMSLWMTSAWDAPAQAPLRDSLLLLSFLTMPQVFFYGMFFLIGQVLNAREDFRPLAWAPIVNNVVQVIVLGAYAGIWATQTDHSVPFTTTQALVLGLGSTLGIVAQTIALWPAWRRLGLAFRFRLDLRGSGLGGTFRLARWAIGVTVLIQVASVVVARLAGGATVADPGRPGPGLLAYNEAYLTWLLPHSLVTVSLATAMLPAASRMASAADLEGVAQEVARAQRLALAFVVPAAAGFVVLADPYASLVFGNGAGASDWRAVSATLACLALGLLPYTIQYIYFRGFYALQRLQSVFWLQLWTSAVNIVAAVAWVNADPNPLTIAPRLAVCYGLSYLVGAVLTTIMLDRRLPGLDVGGMVQQLARALLAVMPGALLAWGITAVVAPRGRLSVIVGFVLGAVVLLGLYLLIARLLGVAELAEAVSLSTRRLRRRTAPTPAPPPPADDTAWVIEEEIGAFDSPLLALPDPDAAPVVIEANDGAAQPGELIGGRLRLDRLLHASPGLDSWLGHDTELPRPALVALLPTDADTTPDVLTAALAASAITDERVLRAVDVRPTPEAAYAGYIHYEYTPAQALELVLRHGPMDDLEACWLVREAAECIAIIHAQGEAHRRLSPDTVFVTRTGDVKIVGLGVAAALTPHIEERQGPEASDVTALGKLLYATLVGRWPGGALYGLPEAPTDAQGRPFSADAVRAGISSDVAEIVDRIINPTATTEPPITTAHDIADALSGILGTANAAEDLRRRVQVPAPAAASAWVEHTPVPPPAGSLPTLRPSNLESSAATVLIEPVPEELGEGSEPLAEQDARPHDAIDQHAAIDGEEATAAMDLSGLDGVPRRQQTPPEVVAVALAPSSRHPGVMLLAALFALALLAGIAGVFVNQYRLSALPPAPGPVAIVTIRDFDPDGDGGDGRENSGQARLAADGRADTVWHTETYGRSAVFNGRKPGVGLLLDLGVEHPVAAVRVTVAGGPTSVQLRVPEGSSTTAAAQPTASSAPKASMASEADWSVVASNDTATGEVTLTPAAPVVTRYVLVYVTKMPPANPAPGYQAGIAEVVVLS